MVSVTRLGLSVTSCYLVKAEDRYILVDTGYEDDWDLFRRRLSENCVSLSQMSHIILTHHHNDHSGLLRNIVRKQGSIRVVMSHRSKCLLLMGVNDLLHYRGWLNKRIQLSAMVGLWPYVSLRVKKVTSLPKLMFTFPRYRLRRCDILVAGETNLRDIGIPLDGRIIETPGHSADSISILFDDGACLVGDAAENFFVFQSLGAKYRTHLIPDKHAYYGSWKKVIAAGAQRIYPGHGCPFSVDKLKTTLANDAFVRK
ncbi:MAG: MBL fold metallo-hydrolase [Halobacteriota archaeon]